MASIRELALTRIGSEMLFQNDLSAGCAARREPLAFLVAPNITR